MKRPNRTHRNKIKDYKRSDWVWCPSAEKVSKEDVRTEIDKKMCEYEKQFNR